MDGSLLFAVFVLLTAAAALVPVAHRLGLGTIPGYLAAGILVGPFGFRLVSNTETVSAVSEFGVVMMLFLIGLELQPRELWRMRHLVIGLGIPQLLLTAALLGVCAALSGFGVTASIVVGLALAMSSTAIAMQSVAQRNLTRTETGRSALAVLLVQDVAVIPILALIPVLAAWGSTPVPVGPATMVDAGQAGWLTAAKVVGAFAVAIAGGRYLVRPLFRFVAMTQAREIFTVLALALVIGAALLTQWAGLSPALGAFLGGVLLADSEYRHELESSLEPFKGLLLGLFFVSVGMSIALPVLLSQPARVLAIVVALVAVKIVVLFALSRSFGLPRTHRLLLGMLLSQAGEFAFVLLQLARDSHSLDSRTQSLLTLVVALSMATTPLLMFVFDRLIGPRVQARALPPSPGYIDSRQKVIVLGYGRFGQTVTRLLRSQSFSMTLIDDDPQQIELMKRFGVKVFYGDAERLDLLQAAGAAQAQMIIIAVAGRERITRIAASTRRAFPKVKIAARAVDRSHAHELIALGIDVFERETFRSALTLAVRALVSLGYSQERAAQLGEAFAAHDSRLLYESYRLRHDEEAYVGLVRRSVESLADELNADSSLGGDASAGPAIPDGIDKESRPAAV